MYWRVYLVINVLSIPFVTSFPGPIDLGQYSESIDNPDLDPIDLDSVSTGLNPDILTGVASNTIDINTDLTTGSSDCPFDFIEPTSQFQRRQIFSSSSRCSHTPQNEPLRQSETEVNPSTLISSVQTGHEATNSDIQALRVKGATSLVVQMEGGGERIREGEAPIPEGGSPGLGAPLVLPVTGVGDHPENLDQDLSFPNLNNVVDFRFVPCSITKFKHRQIPACDHGTNEYIIRGVQDYELMYIRPPTIGTYLYNHVE
ncbi:hypothetical protein MMC29_006564 [Sticta canariensis]|nr:hypothetical protein [Sticta canariensis]